MLKLCLGTAQFGMPYGIANNRGQVSEKEVIQIVSAAVKNNLFFYDTAKAYGDSETVLGKAFLTLAIQDKISCITKLLPNFIFTSEDDLEEQIKESINKLNVTSLWGLLLHRTGEFIDNDAFIKTIAALKGKGLIKYFGISLYVPDEAILYIQKPLIDFVQVPFNVLDRRLIDNHFFTIASNLNKTVFVRSLFLQGLLTFTEKQLANKNMDWASSYLSLLNEFTDTYAIPLNGFVLNVIKSLPGRVIGVFGVDSHEQLLKNMDHYQKAFSKDLYVRWWQSLPPLPEKLLNPSLWKNA